MVDKQASRLIANRRKAMSCYYFVLVLWGCCADCTNWKREVLSLQNTITGVLLCFRRFADSQFLNLPVAVLLSDYDYTFNYLLFLFKDSEREGSCPTPPQCYAVNCRADYSSEPWYASDHHHLTRRRFP